MEPIRLNKFISDTGTCSRREADKLIEQGRVLVNGKVPEVGTRVKAKDKVQVDGRTLELTKETPVYLLLNKPAGIETTTDLSQRDNIIRFVNYPERIFPVGRLDKDSEGLIILTNDGDIVNKILRTGNKHEKEYVVTVDKAITPDFIFKMGNGVSILNVNTKKCIVTQEGPYKFRIVLTQGMNRQIRRMCEALGYEVQTLQRVRIMHMTLAKLPLGQWRDMTETEIEELQRLVAGSTKTEEGSIGKKRANAHASEDAAPARISKPAPRRMGSTAGRAGGTGSNGKGITGKRETPKSGGKSARGSRGVSKGGLNNVSVKRSGKGASASGTKGATAGARKQAAGLKGAPKKRR